MSIRIHDKIREVLENTPGLTQKGLAEKMGLNPAAVNRMLYGRRNIMAEEIPIIEDYLGVSLHLSAPDDDSRIYRHNPAADSGKLRGFADIGSRHNIFLPESANPRSFFDASVIPVYGDPSGGMQKGLNLSSGDVIDWVARHPIQFGIRNAFAVYVSSDSMEPRYFRGELVYIHPGRPPEINKDCLVEMNGGEARIYRLLGRNGDRIRIAEYNPPVETEIPLKDIKSLYAVIGRG